MALLHKIRMRYGLRWKKSYPGLEDLREPLTYLGIIVLIIGAYLVAQLVTDLGNARANESEATTNALNCLNGGRFRTVNAVGETVVTVCHVEEFNIGKEGI